MMCNRPFGRWHLQIRFGRIMNMVGSKFMPRVKASISSFFQYLKLPKFLV